VNVGVAWGFAVYGSHAFGDDAYSSSHSDGLQWVVKVGTVLGQTRVSRVPNNGVWDTHSESGVTPELIPYWSNASDRPPEEVFNDPTLPWYKEFGYGWPCRSGYVEVRTVVRTKTGQHIPRNVWSTTSGIEIVADNPNNRLPYFRVLPLRPIFPGFLIDTLFYGVIWYGLFFGTGATRRAIRRKRGRCPMCGYDLRGNFESGCSECGWNREVAE